MTETQGSTARTDVSVAADGRVAIPAQLRNTAGIVPGSRLVAYVERGRVVLEERAHLLTRVQDEAIAAARASGHTDNPVDSLIADRRAEAAREDASPTATMQDTSE
jgi:bifunctional DNA-binding transcriptional regulator/antitoxin component of YhaV-PrlF toxin-antitoxin module